MSDQVTRIPGSWLAIAGFCMVLVTSIVTITNVLTSRLTTLETRVPMLEASMTALMAQNTLQQSTIDELKLSGARMAGDVSMIRSFVERMERRMDAPQPMVKDRR